MTVIYRKPVLLLYALLLFIGITLVSYSQYLYVVPVLLGLLGLGVWSKNSKYMLMSGLFLVLGFLLYKIAADSLGTWVTSKQTEVILNRLLLCLVVLLLGLGSILFRQPLKSYLNKPDWNNKVYFPFITHGFHSVQVSRFLMIAIIINVSIFVPIILMMNDTHSLRELLVFAVLFSITNSVLEEVIWRGVLLSRIRSFVSDRYAIMVTSICFGLQHISIGIPFLISLLLSVGGVFFAIVVIRSNSIFPSILWHFIINLGMVYSGVII